MKRAKELLGDIKDNTLIVFDTNSLLNIFRYGLLSSKVLLDFIETNKSNVWVPYQVKSEFIKNKQKVYKPNYYKNLKNEMNSKVKTEKEKLINQLLEYENKRFTGLIELKDNVEIKFNEINTIIDEYNDAIMPEITAYKEFITNADKLMDELLGEQNVGEKPTIIELMEIFKEGELRYKYNIAPGFSDKNKKEDKSRINSFEIRTDIYGDLIVWKEVIKKAQNMTSGQVIFITNDTEKNDWFNKDDKGKLIPREELIEEFYHYNQGVELIILSFEQFLENVPTIAPEKELLLDIRKAIFIKRIDKEKINELIFKSMISPPINDVKIKLDNLIDYKEYIDGIIEDDFEFEFDKEKFELKNINVFIDKEDVLYRFEVIINARYDVISQFHTIEASGVIDADLTIQFEFQTKVNFSERELIEKINGGTLPLIIKNIEVRNASYYWSGEIDVDEYDDSSEGIADAYTECPCCGDPINHHNDAGNGFCIKCSQ